MSAPSSLYDNLYNRQSRKGDEILSQNSNVVTSHAASTPSSGVQAKNQDFYRGFYEGMIQRRDSSSDTSKSSRWKYFLTSYIAPVVANSMLFLLPFIYLRLRADKSFLEKFPFSYMKSAFSQGAKNKPSSESLMDMFSPLKPKNFEIKLNYQKNTRVLRFKDVLGVDDAKKELMIYKNYIEDPKKYTRFGAKLPKGMLMIGKPGTGKTLLMRAFVNECNKHLWSEECVKQGLKAKQQKFGKVALFSAVGSDFIELYGGSGPKRVRELFHQAKQKLDELKREAAESDAGSCAVVIFIDEIDALGCRGGGSTSGGRSLSGGISSEENRTINQILSELDGLESAENIVVVGATNNPDALDKALLREGRFDKKVHLSLPDLAARKTIFENYLDSIVTSATSQDDTKSPESIHKSIIATELAERTPGTSPAQISTIVNEAAITAAVRDQRAVNRELLHDAVDDVLIGKKRRGRMSDNSTRRTSVHECGHCLVAWFSPERLQTKVLKVSLIPRGMAGGYTQQLEREENDLISLDTLFSTLCVLVGGRIAEELVYNRQSLQEIGNGHAHELHSFWDARGDAEKICEGISTGAYDDLQRATKIATEIILSFGTAALASIIQKQGSDGVANLEASSILAFPTQEKKNGRGWLPFSENHHQLVEDGAKKILDAAFTHARQLLIEKQDLLLKLSEILLKNKEIDHSAIEQVLGPRSK